MRRPAPHGHPHCLNSRHAASGAASGAALWAAMAAAAVLVLLSALAACRVSPAERPSVAAFPAPRAAEAEGPDIRVRVGKAIDTVRIDPGGRVACFDVLDPAERWSGEGPVTFTRRPGGFHVEPAGVTLRSDRLRLVPASGSAVVGTGADIATLRGTLELIAGEPVTGSDRFDLIEALPIERYLPGVLAKELYHDFHPVAYEAQAIAARTYALHERQRRLALGSRFDVEASTLDQAYAGASDHPRAARAVEKTTGVVLTWQGQLLRTYYSSTCGDRPASARDTWPTTRGFEFNNAAPIQAAPRPCACTASPRHRWSLERPLRETAARLAAWGRAAGNPVRALSGLRDIVTAERNRAGRPSRYRVTDERGRRYDLSAEDLRVALNTRADGAAPVTRETRVPSGDLSARVSGGRLLLDGRGFGHGVGMCQFGANGLAKQGLSAPEILNRYYPGARVERAYE